MAHSAKFAWRMVNGLRVRFCGNLRVDETGVNVFALELPNGRHSFGEFVTACHADHETYGIEVRSFGYSNEDNVRNPSPGARYSFKAMDIEIFRDCITGLFGFREDLPFPLGRDGSGFDGVVRFVPGWLRER